MAVQCDILLAPGERFAGGDADLLFHQIEAGHHFRHAMLDLDTGIHLHEIDFPIAVQQKFHGAGVDIAHRLRGIHRGFADLPALLRADGDGGRFLDQLLVGVFLDGAVALAKMDDVVLFIGQHLDFNMARLLI